jgi:hypothetical protein
LGIIGLVFSRFAQMYYKGYAMADILLVHKNNQLIWNVTDEFLI